MDYHDSDGERMPDDCQTSTDPFDDDEPFVSDTELDGTSFDDVAMILLLFFMVMSMAIHFTERPSEEDQERRAPISQSIDDFYNVPDGVTYEIFVKSTVTRGLMIFLKRIGEEGDGKVFGREFFVPGAGGSKDLPEFREALMEAVGDAKPPSKTAAKGGELQRFIDLKVFVEHDIPLSTIQYVQVVLETLKTSDDVFLSKVARIASRSEVVGD